MKLAALLLLVSFAALIDFGFAGDDSSCECECDEKAKREKFHNDNLKKIEEQKKAREENERIYKQRQIEHAKNQRKIEIRNQYKKKDCEDEKEYFRRICEKVESSEEEYIERLTLIRSYYPTLKLWYEDDYLYDTRHFYSQVYSRKSYESEEQYYRRLLSKEDCEDELNWANRVNVLRVLYPSLSLWHEDCYYNSFTKHYYEVYYKQRPNEDCQTYNKRIFKKCSGEDEEDYWKRIKLVQKTHAGCKCWQKKKYFKDVGVCSCILNAKSESELKQRIEAERSGNSCKNNKLGVVKGLFSNIFNRKKDNSDSSSDED